MSTDKPDKIMEYLEDLNKRISDIENNLSTRNPEISVEQDPFKAVKQESFIEFFKKFDPKNETDKTLVIMFFLESRRNIKHITTKDIAEGYKEVREKTPVNVSDKVQLLHKKGLIMPGEIVNNLKGWIITRSGLEYLKKLKNETK
ncbi:hypothetical protein J4436_04445 [Candidatus Woesearchaeota archaeon]|nr:hypothetical protein [Candidatus Woesearchaeota archaeon]